MRTIAYFKTKGKMRVAPVEGYFTQEQMKALVLENGFKPDGAVLCVYVD